MASKSGSASCRSDSGTPVFTSPPSSSRLWPPPAATSARIASMAVLRAAMPYSPSAFFQKRPWWSLVCSTVMAWVWSGCKRFRSAQPDANSAASKTRWRTRSHGKI